MIQIVAAGGFTEIFETGHRREMLVELTDVVGVSAEDGSEFTLPYQSVAEIGKERQVVGPEEARKMLVARRREMPDVIQCDLAGEGLIALTRVNRIVKAGNVDWHQPRNLRLAVVSEEERGEPVQA